MKGETTARSWGVTLAEYLGTELQIAIQKRIFKRQNWLANTPEIANGGRILNFLDPDKTSWERVVALAHKDKIAAFTAVRPEALMVMLKAHFGAEWKTQHWDVFFGAADQVLAACSVVIDTTRLPAGWRIQSFTNPEDALINEIQEFNISTGIAPYPAYYSRGQIIPCLSTCLWDEKGNLAATASANCRYHHESRFGNHVFAGSVSVSNNYRGMGLGKLANATTLADSHKQFGWKRAIEQAKPDNTPSRRMIESSGLTRSEELVTISVINADEDFTR